MSCKLWWRVHIIREILVTFLIQGFSLILDCFDNSVKMQLSETIDRRFINIVNQSCLPWPKTTVQCHRSDAAARSRWCCIRLRVYSFFYLASSCASFTLNSFAAAEGEPRGVLPPSACLRSFRVDAFCNARSTPVASVDETTRRTDSAGATANAPYNYGESQSRYGVYRLAWFARTSTRTLAAASIISLRFCNRRTDDDHIWITDEFELECKLN